MFRNKARITVQYQLENQVCGFLFQEGLHILFLRGSDSKEAKWNLEK